MIMANNWSVYDQSRNRDGERFADAVFAALPPDAVLLTYWNALTTLGYEHRGEGRRPDVAVRSFDEAARVACDAVEGSLTDVANDRPLFALFAVEELDPVREAFTPEPGRRLQVPYGKRELDHAAILYPLVPLP